MRRYVHIFLLVLTAALVVGCQREPYITQSTPVLTLTLQVPSPTMVKATVPASEAETAIHDLKIWVFRSDNHELVTHLELTAGEFPQPGSVKRYSLPVSWEFAQANVRPMVDVYVLANSASIGQESLYAGEPSETKAVSSWSDVSGATFSNFAPSEKIVSISEENGLPMSGVAKELTISGEAPTLSISTVSLERCVSKIRFLFSQIKTVSAENPSILEETVSVERIELDGSTVPTSESVFALSAPHVSDTYGTGTVDFLGNTPLVAGVSETPEAYSYPAGQSTPAAYEQVVSEALAAGEIAGAGGFYIRESDRKISGVIHYKVTNKNGESRPGTVPFTLPDANFPRNHTWTVYGYYVTNRSLQLSVSVLPWDKSDYDIDFSTSSLMVTGKLKVLDNSVADISRIGTTDEYNVTLKSNSPAIAYLYVATPKGGKLQVLVNGDTDAFDVWFSDEPDKSRETTIDPDKNSGRIDLSIYRKESYQGVAKGKTITLDFVAYTPDGDREIEGASECIDQIFNFILP